MIIHYVVHWLQEVHVELSKFLTCFFQSVSMPTTPAAAAPDKCGNMNWIKIRLIPTCLRSVWVDWGWLERPLHWLRVFWRHLIGVHLCLRWNIFWVLWCGGVVPVNFELCHPTTVSCDWLIVYCWDTILSYDWSTEHCKVTKLSCDCSDLSPGIGC